MTSFETEISAHTGEMPNTGSFAENCGTGILPVFGNPRTGRMPMPLILTALGETPRLPALSHLTHFPRTSGCLKWAVLV